jgi:hypothetical protein
MDVHCTTCGEPWDVYHLWHEAIYETGLNDEQVKIWESLPHAEKLNDCYRKQFRASRWEFGRSVINVIRCPCCPKNAKLNAERLHTKAALEDLFGEDEDGLAATFEDFQL